MPTACRACCSSQAAEKAAGSSQKRPCSLDAHELSACECLWDAFCVQAQSGGGNP